MQVLDDDCLRQIFLYLPPTDLLMIEEVSPHWRSVALSTWSSFKILNIKSVYDTPHFNKIIGRAGKYITTLNLDECKDREVILNNISGHLPNLTKIKFNEDIIITDQQLIKVFSNYKIMHELINENNIINIMRWASKLRLDTPLARATLKVLELQGENLIREKEIFDLLIELQHSKRILLRSYYCWSFSDNEFNTICNRIIAKELYRKYKRCRISN